MISAVFHFMLASVIHLDFSFFFPSEKIWNGNAHIYHIPAQPSIPIFHMESS